MPLLLVAMLFAPSSVLLVRSHGAFATPLRSTSLLKLSPRWPGHDGHNQSAGNPSLAMASTLEAMIAMAFNLIAMASNLRAMASNPKAMASNLYPNRNGLHPNSDGLQPVRELRSNKVPQPVRYIRAASNRRLDL